MTADILNRLTFGGLAAERDEGLKEYFIESPSFERLRDGSKTVALGSRGSGKSAIFRMIAQEARARRALVVELAPEDYSYELLSRSMASEARGSWQKQGAYAAAWKFLIYVTAMKEATRSGGYKGGPAARIYSYLRDNHATLGGNPIGTLISYLKRLEGVKIGQYEAAMKTRELQRLYRLEEINSLLEDLNTLCSSRGVVILIDELDKGWDASEDAVAFVAGLFQAATSINHRTPAIRVLISLRRELYDNIPALYEDAQKVRDLIEEIEWDEPQLLDMITRRIAHSLPETAEGAPQERWNVVFAETLDYRQAKSFNYVIDRTLYRPRELIQSCKQIQEVAEKRGVTPPIDYGVISQAEHSFSEARLKDIAAEYRFEFPGLLDVFETFRGTAYTLSRDSLEEHCLKLALGEYRVPEASSWVENTEPDKVIDTLWKVGFLRARATGGVKGRRRSGSAYLGSYQVSSINLRNIDYFHVHPMFRSYLGLKEQKGA